MRPQHSCSTSFTNSLTGFENAYFDQLHRYYASSSALRRAHSPAASADGSRYGSLLIYRRPLTKPRFGSGPHYLSIEYRDHHTIDYRDHAHSGKPSYDRFLP